MSEPKAEPEPAPVNDAARVYQELNFDRAPLPVQVVAPGAEPSVARAVAFGGAAALLGSLVYFGVRAALGYEFGLIAIGVGIAVGVAVRKGASGSAHRGYRILAIALAYTSVVATHVPGMLHAAGGEHVTAGLFVSATLLSFAMPFLMLREGEIMSVVIMSFALWEAWKFSTPRNCDGQAGTSGAMTTEASALEAACPDCGASVPRGALSCPACGALLHRVELAELSTRASAHAEHSELEQERATLERMLLLLPDTAPQARTLRLRLVELKAKQPVAPSGNEAAKPRGPLTLLGVLSLALWKFKALLLLLVTKGKLLLFGLTKAKTVFSMLLALGAYWTIWGWQFALGFVLSVYVHEMGHVIALRRLGIPASAPMFIPFVGAFVRLNRGPDTVHDDAIAGLAGPIYGLGAALFCYALFALTGISLFGALARTGAWLNLFNLIPVWQLDGGRAFNALNRAQRWGMVVIIAGVWFWFHDSMLILLMLGAIYRSFTTPAPDEPDRRSMWSYGLLVVVLAAMTHIHLPQVASHSAFGP